MAALSQLRRVAWIATFACGRGAAGAGSAPSAADSLALPADSLALADSLAGHPASPLRDTVWILAGVLLLILLFHRRSS